MAMPLTAPFSVPVAAGALWFGMVGGGFPDWFDLRSDFRRAFRLRHRGASHGLPILVVMTALCFAGLMVLAQGDIDVYEVGLSPAPETVRLWTAAFALGMFSHLVSDACTRGGIRPMLPFAQWRVWLLPRFMRSRYDGYLDRIARVASLIVLIAFGVLTLVQRGLLAV